jgi:hypothetical protein
LGRRRRRRWWWWWWWRWRRTRVSILRLHGSLIIYKGRFKILGIKACLVVFNASWISGVEV